MDGCIVMVVMIDSIAVGTMKPVTQICSPGRKSSKGTSQVYRHSYPEQKHNEEPGVVYTFRLNDDLENGFEN